MMEQHTQLERLFLELLRGLNEQQQKDVIRIMEAFLRSTN